MRASRSFSSSRACTTRSCSASSSLIRASMLSASCFDSAPPAVGPAAARAGPRRARAGPGASRPPKATGIQTSDRDRSGAVGAVAALPTSRVGSEVPTSPFSVPSRSWSAREAGSTRCTGRDRRQARPGARDRRLQLALEVGGAGRDRLGGERVREIGRALRPGRGRGHGDEVAAGGGRHLHALQQRGRRSGRGRAGRARPRRPAASRRGAPRCARRARRRTTRAGR